MSTNTLKNNITQVIADFLGIKNAIIEKGVDVLPGTRTSDYDDLIRQIQGDIITDEIVKAAVLCLRRSNYDGGAIDSNCNAFTNEITDGSLAFASSGKINGISASFNRLVNGTRMFHSCGMLWSIDTTFPNLETGERMFAGTYVMSVGEPAFPKLRNGKYMFNNVGEMTSFSANIDKLTEGEGMFYNCSTLQDFTTSIPALENGKNMFLNCTQLTVESMLNVLNSIPDRTGNTQATITFGARNLPKLTAAQIAIGTNKNWIVE